MAEIVTQGVDIQLKILQALLSLVTSLPDVHGTTLGDVSMPYIVELLLIGSTGTVTLLSIARVTHCCCLFNCSCDTETTRDVRI